MSQLFSRPDMDIGETSTHIAFQSSVFAWIKVRNQTKLVAVPRKQPSSKAGASCTEYIVGTVVTVRRYGNIMYVVYRYINVGIRDSGGN